MIETVSNEKEGNQTKKGNQTKRKKEKESENKYKMIQESINMQRVRDSERGQQ